MLKRIIVAILLLPLAEIVAFVLIAALIGTGPALLLMLASSLAGFLVLRAAGRSGLARFRGAVANPDGIRAGGGGLLDVLAGLLLLVPGLLTSLAGALLLLGPVRRAGQERFARWLRRGRPADPGTLDLKPDEWKRVRDRELPRDPDRRSD
jgi:UPF0716 protein FxsA